MKYNKLVRDRIPEIIRQKGGKPQTHTATHEEYRKRLKMKLEEEVAEFLKSEDDAELADILEVIYAIAGAKGISKRKLESLRRKKARERGGFKKRIILEEA